MKKLLENRICRSLLSTVLFGVFYALLLLVLDGGVEIGYVLKSMAAYFMVTLLLYFAAPKLRKITGHDEGTDE